MRNPASTILAQYLISKGLVSEVIRKTNWPVFLNFIPDKTDASNVCILYDEKGNTDGKTMSGDVVEHPGLCVFIRSDKPNIGYAKTYEITTELNTIVNQTVVFENETYTIRNVGQTSTILPLGMDPLTRLYMFTCHFQCTISVQ